METQSIVVLSLVSLVFLGLGILRMRNKKFKKRLFQLAKNSRLTNKEKDKEIYPSFKQKNKWLYIKRFNPLINELHFDSKLLTSFSNLYGVKFTRAVYENNALILKSSRAKKLSFQQDHPENLKPYQAFIGSNENGKDHIIDTKDNSSALISGPMGTGKSMLASLFHQSLIKTSGEEKSYILCKNRNDFKATDATVFISKDDKAKILWHLKEIKTEVLERQKDIQNQGLRSGFEAGYRPIYIICDEVHSYGKNLPSSFSKEDREIQSAIIEILRFLLLQGRSSVIYIMFLTPGLEKSDLDIPVRECAFYFTSKMSSEEIANNMFGNSIPFLMEKEVGLFAFSDRNATTIIKVAGEE